MKTVTEKGQNIIDLVIQCYGRVEDVFTLIQDNDLGGLDVSISDGVEIEYSKIENNGVQAFYDDRKLRVKTGDSQSEYTQCAIPEGHVLWQFRIDLIEDGVVFMFAENGVCPSPEEVGFVNPDRLIFLGVPLLSTEHAANEFVLWTNSQNEGYAFASGNTVSVFFPKSKHLCGEQVSLCIYRRVGDGYLSGNSKVSYVNGGLTRCCEDTIASIQDIIETAQNNASYE